jgi:hypothetical protein
VTRWIQIAVVVALFGAVGVLATDTRASRDDQAAREAQARLSTSASVQQGMAVDGLINVTDVNVTATTNGQITATAKLYPGASTTPMDVSVSYTDQNNWTIIVQRNSAGPDYAPPAGTALNINNVSGTITKASGRLSYQLTLAGQTIGDGTFDMVVTVDTTGLVASALVQDMKVGGMTLKSASVLVTTATATANLTATLVTNGGTFDATLDVTGPGPKRGTKSPLCGRVLPSSSASCKEQPTYRIALTVTGADLAGSNSQFTLTSFGFSTVIDTESYGCKYVDTAFNGSAKVGNNTYTLKNAEIAFCGEDLRKFIFAFAFSHYEPWSKVTKTVDLTIAWTNIPGTYTTPSRDNVNYTQGYFGSVDLSAQRTFSKKYKSRTFHRGVTIGLVFGVAVYQPTSGAQYTSVIGGGGYFDADRVSGAIGCKFQVSPGTDMDCGGELRLNPSWAGVYHHRWDDL